MMHLLWIHYGSLTTTLDRATWLETATELSKTGWQVTLLAEAIPGNLDDSVERVTIKTPKKFFLRFLYFHTLLLKYLLAGKFEDKDVVLFNQKTGFFLLPFVPLLRLIHGKRQKYVMDSRTVPMETESSSGKRSILIFNIAHALAGSIADGQTSNTAYMAQCQKVSPTQLLGVWPAGVQIEKFRIASESRSWFGPNGEIRLIYIGTLQSKRNLTGMCEAAIIARHKNVKVVFTIVGDGPQREELELLAKNDKLNVIRVIPPVSSEEVPQILSYADIGVIPFPDIEIFRTGTPIKQFEYMAAGMPLLVTRVICHTNIIKDYDVAFWAQDASPENLAKAISEAYSRKKDFPKMGKLALSLSEDYSWANSAACLSRALINGFRGDTIK